MVGELRSLSTFFNIALFGSKSRFCYFVRYYLMRTAIHEPVVKLLKELHLGDVSEPSAGYSDVLSRHIPVSRMKVHRSAT